MNKHAIAEKQPTKATDKFQLTASMKSSSSIQISKQQTEMLPIQIDSVQGSADIAEIETMEISDITESHENQRSSSSNLEKLVQSREKLSEVVGQAEAEATLFSSEKIQTIDLSRSSSLASQPSCSDFVEIVCVVKPRHERTPEIIDLSSEEIDGERESEKGCEKDADEEGDSEKVGDYDDYSEIPSILGPMFSSDEEIEI